MKTNIMISKVEHQYNINLDEVDKKYLSHWIEKKIESSLTSVQQKHK
jgi:hypothetical protein